MSNIDGFLTELDTLSRKYGIWIEVNCEEDVCLVDGEYNVIATTFYNDEDTQKYIVGSQ